MLDDAVTCRDARRWPIGGYILSEKGEVILRRVGTLRYVSILSENSACQVPICAVAADGFTIHANKWFLGAGFLGAPPISLSRSMYIYIYIYIYSIYIYIYIYAHIYIYIYTYIHTYILYRLLETTCWAYNCSEFRRGARTAASWTLYHYLVLYMFKYMYMCVYLSLSLSFPVYIYIYIYSIYIYIYYFSYKYICSTCIDTYIYIYIYICISGLRRGAWTAAMWTCRGPGAGAPRSAGLMI